MTVSTWRLEEFSDYHRRVAERLERGRVGGVRPQKREFTSFENTARSISFRSLVSPSYGSAALLLSLIHISEPTRPY